MPDRRKPPKSKYTADRNMPGAFEGETVTRRRFMNLTAQGAGLVAVAAFTLPALGFALAPVFHQSPYAVAADRAAQRLPRDDLPDEGDRPGTGDRRGGQVDRLRALAQSCDRHRARGPVQQVGRAVLALHAPRLPGAVRGRRPAVHLPVPRWRLRLPRDGRRRPAGASARPLLHAPEPVHRPGRARPALLGQLRACALLRPATPASRSTASASTSTRRASRPRRSPPDKPCPSFPHHRFPRS